MIVFDIESAALPDDQLFANAPPFVPPDHPGDFDPAAVKTGNIKDPAKKQEKIDEARRQHEAAIQSYQIDVAQKRVEWKNAIRNKAALDPTTGYVLAIGYLLIDDATGQRESLIDYGPEFDLLFRFWAKWRTLGESRRFIGHNIYGFDLPFLIRRSWILGVTIPADARDRHKVRNVAIDTLDCWLCGQRLGSCEANLNHVARTLGVGEKNGNGAEFAKLFLSGSETDRQVALAYVANDLNLTASIASKMGLI